MANMIELVVYSFSADKAYNSSGGYIVRNIKRDTDHSLYISNIYINIDAIKLAYDLSDKFLIVKNDNTLGNPLEISCIVLSDGYELLTSREEFVKIYKAGGLSLRQDVSSA